ncbi:uncharacterized protein FMAN_06282 [Fusarium mangiferae]|uniref:Uncharacterized protein n=1 Tax=Fusarium mangiferae TaxID=192010 RepID=A0A1L7STA0_FUSMA|nr:uncharacterized protein FMAN_06282 [Fusarium mangiferae]CVK86446.1 uncharacterized protein FMAN_06282 [Fusarium mangiferae]
MMLPTKELALAMNCFLSLAAAASYDYCACQTKTDGALDDTKTSLVARSCGDSYSFVYGPASYDATSKQPWLRRNSGPGPRFQGLFLQSIFGKIDGNLFYDLCKDAGAKDSSCFNCARFQQNGPSQGGTFQCTE